MISFTITIAFSITLLGAVGVGFAAPPAAEDQATPLPDTVDLRPQFEKWGLAQRRQGSRGTCSVFAVTGAIEFATACEQKKGTRLSVEFLNWAAHKAVNRREDGGFFSDLWKGYEVSGICSEADLPYQSRFDADLQPQPATIEHAKANHASDLSLHWIKEWNVHTGLTDAQMKDIKKALVSKWPVCGGFRWPKRAVWKEGVLQMCPPEEVFDGHSVLLVGYRQDMSQPGGGVFLIRNSGGDGSDGMMPYAYVQAYMNDAAWIAPKHAQPRPASSQSLEPRIRPALSIL